MDIKSKKSKAFRVWLCFFIGVNIIGFFILLGVSVSGNINQLDMAMFGSDLKATQVFKHTLAIRFDTLARCITDNIELNEDTDGHEEYITDDFRREEALNVHMKGLNDEGENLIYYAKNPKTEKILTNAKTDLGISTEGSISLPAEYDFYLYYNGEKFIVEKDGQPLDIYRRDSGYWNTLFRPYIEEPDSYMEQGIAAKTQYREFYDIRDCHIFLAIKKNIAENPYGHSSFYWLQNDIKNFKWIMLGVMAAFILGIGLLVFSIMKRKDKREFEKRVGQLLGKITIELKILISLMVFVFLMNIVDGVYWIDDGFIILFILICLWWLYLIWLDLRINGRNVFSNNIVNGLIKRYRRFEKKRPFQKALLFRGYTAIGTAISIASMTIICFVLVFNYNEGFYFIPGLIIPIIGAYLLYRYLKRYKNTVDDIGKVMDQTELIKKGDMATKLQLSPDADLYMLEDNLNTIQEGIARAVEDSIKSERMKVELITNISHDLKTPLTSIISYVDLLSKEGGLPEYVKDYIKILTQKSERLKLLIQDLFDLSKAVSGEMEFERKALDLGKLIEQTLADLEEQISESQLIFRVNIPDSPVPIISDGNKLYRVFLNLFLNTLKYSLIGTRVYVDLVLEDGKAIVTIKNTANYEMNFNEEEIIERFVRGDEARSSEGSGLGLAIAQSFTQSCGGDFDIKVDGDLFKVILSFDKKFNKGIENDEVK